MKVQDVITRVKRSFGDEAGVQITDDDIVRWINDANLYIVSQNENLLQQSDYMDIVKGQQMYIIQTMENKKVLNLLTISLKKTDDDGYRYIPRYSVNEFNEMINGWDDSKQKTGFPVGWMSFAWVIKFFPVPDFSATQGMKYYFNSAPLPVTATSPFELELPLQYHNSIVNYCLQQAYELDENYTAANMKEQQVNIQVHNNRFNDAHGREDFYSTITTRLEDM